MLVPVSEAKGRLSELVRDSVDEDVILLRHGRPAAVIVSVERLDALIEELEDARDRLAVIEAAETPDDMFIPLEKVKVEFGLLEDAPHRRRRSKGEHPLMEVLNEDRGD